ncbi:hypothetical protein [Bifidobacterium avesanii]|uniref:Uncharacterized protein n=1 Tax=Bifidobacterium avesanii TaxID=1798157 RepID=A0A7K3TG24_9BIFI|nr:hypothetical protein [Bifidobacterium avesanii]KAB8294522.1 hypothetical protein DSM100685_0315 [Bifidobacterium avesanii]NEG78038.1 hypothetical protein [Bifidobacterium avesanii]
MANEAQLIRAMNRLSTAIEGFTDVYRRINDPIYGNVRDAAEAVHVSEVYFRENYARQTEHRQGNSAVFLRSDLLERKEQLRMECSGRRYYD